MTFGNRAPGPDRARATWVDAAKGLAILMVVTHHCVMALDGLDLLPSSVTFVNYSFAAFRMPLLLLASGLFAGRLIGRSWRMVMHRRVAQLGYLYLVWGLMYFAAFTVVPRSVAPRPEGLEELVSWLWEPRTSLWFIYGLAVATVAVKVMNRWPLWFQVLLGIVLAVVSDTPLMSDAGFAWQGICAHFVFFLVGVRCSQSIRASALRVTVPVVLAWGLVASLSLVATGVFDLHDVPGVALLRAAAFTAFLIGLCALLDGSRVSWGLQWLGERTLPVYLIHPLWIAVVTAPLIGRGDSWSGAAGIGFLVALVVTSLSVSWWAARCLNTWRAGWLFELPSAWRWQEPIASRRSAVVGPSGLR